MIPLMFLLGASEISLSPPTLTPTFISCSNMQQPKPVGTTCTNYNQTYNGVAIGDSYAGGYYAGMYKLDNHIFALIMSPNNQGNGRYVFCNSTTLPANLAATSMVDGLYNTQNMYDVNKDIFPAAKWAREKNINGFTDWYIPSYYELVTLERNCYAYTTTSNPTYVSTCSDATADQIGTVLRGLSGYNPYAYPCPRYSYNTDPMTQTPANIFRTTEGFVYYSDTGYTTSYISPITKKKYGLYPNLSDSSLGLSWIYDTYSTTFQYAIRLIRRQYLFSI